jgi:heat-inducible transcriptional repressor
MSDLEQSGYINHPHTSAGRMPTDKGYRFYVDSLMNIKKLGKPEIGMINKTFKIDLTDTEEILNLTSSLLSSITKQLACVIYPKLDTGILEKLQIVSLSSTRILVVISIKSGLVKTITLELKSDIKPTQIVSIENMLNEKLAGLTLSEIRSTFKERFKDIHEDHKPIIRLFIDSVDKIFKDVKQNEKMYLTGAKNVIKQPEFENPQRFQSVIELIEDQDIIVHILEKGIEAAQDQVFISIGSENMDRKLEDYSFISKDYKVGDISGTLGIVGPKRMEYSRVVAIVDYIAKMLTEVLTNSTSK